MKTQTTPLKQPVLRGTRHHVYCLQMKFVADNTEAGTVNPVLSANNGVLWLDAADDTTAVTPG